GDKRHSRLPPLPDLRPRPEGGVARTPPHQRVQDQAEPDGDQQEGPEEPHRDPDDVEPLELEKDADQEDDQARREMAPVRQHPREPDPDEQERPVISQPAGPNVAEVLENEQRSEEQEKQPSDQPRSPPPFTQRIHHASDLSRRTYGKRVRVSRVNR